MKHFFINHTPEFKLSNDFFLLLDLLLTLAELHETKTIEREWGVFSWTAISADEMQMKKLYFTKSERVRTCNPDG